VEDDLAPRRRRADGDRDERDPREAVAAGDRFADAPRRDERDTDRDDDEPSAGEPRREPAGDSDQDGEGEPRRRRRRGRRGGRRRRGGDREGEAAVRSTDRDAAGSRERAETAGRTSSEMDDEDEPLPSGYGVRPAARVDTGREDAAAGRGEDEQSADSRGEDREPGKRRRRRRRRGEGRSREAGTTAEGGGTGSSRRASDSSSSGQRRGRRGRRSGDERRSASTLERGRRGEFAPVAGGREEDDEGLEFLGLEEAGHDPAPRGDRHREEDESIIESGLHDVLDVPSWVEAIGIVIAGNLDSRSRGSRGGSSEGSRPADGGRGDRPRESRRGGRSGDQR
jgi:hypothetical protein